MNAQIEEATRLADSNAQLRRDLAALRHALERSQSERDTWRERYTDTAMKYADFIRTIRQLCGEKLP